MIRWLNHDITIDREKGTITRAGITVHFRHFVRVNSRTYIPDRKWPSKYFQYVCLLILDSPKTYQEIFDFMYGDDPDGGPVMGRHYIYLLHHYTKKRLKQVGLKLNHDAGCYMMRRYWLEPVDDTGRQGQEGNQSLP